MKFNLQVVISSNFLGCPEDGMNGSSAEMMMTTFFPYAERKDCIIKTDKL